MMKLSIMKNILETNSSLVEDVLEKWNFDQDTVHLLRASSNFVFSFKQNGTPFILRITPEGDNNRIQEELSLLTFLLESDILVNEPIPSRNGNYIEKFSSSLGNFYAVVFTYLEGQQYELEELEDGYYYLWGEALGNLHQLSIQYALKNKTPKENFSIQKLIKQTEESLPNNETYAHNELQEIKGWMEELVITDSIFGRIHFDFELDNLIWKDQTVQIIDFESSLDGWFAADIAFALRDLFEDEVDFSSHYFQEFIKGYQSCMEIVAEDLNNIPMFLRLHNLITFTKLIKTIDLENNPNNPDWIEGLMEKLKLKLKYYRSSFLKFHE